jgi:hypothetical protein
MRGKTSISLQVRNLQHLLEDIVPGLRTSLLYDRAGYRQEKTSLAMIGQDSGID